MSNYTRTHIDTRGPIVEVDRDAFEDGTVAFGGADTLAPGTILARHTGSGKFQIYVKGGSSNGNGVPVAVLTYELEATGAGDKPVRPALRGKFNKKKLVIDADGDDANIDFAVLDLLRDVGIYAYDVEQLGREDNPQPTESDS
jgi:hypothetical protein